MRDTLTKDRSFGKVIIKMQRIPVTGNLRKFADVFIADMIGNHNPVADLYLIDSLA